MKAKFEYMKDFSDYRYYLIPFFPLSHNSAYQTAKFSRGRFLRKEYADYKDAIKEILAGIDEQAENHPLFGDAYQARFVALLTKSRMFYKKGSFQRTDIDGFLKLAVDSVFDYLNINDSTMVSCLTGKVVVEELPATPVSYTSEYEWNEKEKWGNGNLLIAIRTVPVGMVNEPWGEHDHFPSIERMILNASTWEDYRSPAPKTQPPTKVKKRKKKK